MHQIIYKMIIIGVTPLDQQGQSWRLSFDPVTMKGHSGRQKLIFSVSRVHVAFDDNKSMMIVSKLYLSSKI